MWASRRAIRLTGLRSPIHKTPVVLLNPRRSLSGGTPANQPKIIPDYMTPLPAHQLATLLTDLLPDTAPQESPSPVINDQAPQHLPPGAHLVYFPPLVPASELALDGAEAHHVPPGFLLATPEDKPDGPVGGRRLWAGGQLSFKQGWRGRLRLDARPWICRETISRMEQRGVDKTFVDVVRRYGLPDDEEGDITETRTLVFVGGGTTNSKPPTTQPVKFPHQPTASHTFTATPTQLFHFSALTYNAHFIHLDRATALVHGPLMLTLMLRALEHHGGPGIRSLTYRNLSPLGVGQPARVCVRAAKESSDGDGKEAWDVWIEGPEGGLVARGKAEMEK